MADDALTAAIKRRLYPQGTDPTALSASGTTPPSSVTLPTPSSLSQFGDFDPTYEGTMASIGQKQNSANDQYSQAIQALRNQFAPQYQGLQTQYDDAQGQLQAGLANNGILYSSNNAASQGQLGSSFQNLFSQLQGQQQTGETGLANQRNATLQDLLGQSLQAQGQHAGFLAGRAEDRASQEAAANAAAAQKADQDRQNVQQLLDAGMTPEQISAQLGIPVIGISSNSTGQYGPSSSVTTPFGAVSPSASAAPPPLYTDQNSADNLLANLTGGLDQYQDSPWAVNQASGAYNVALQNATPGLSALLQSSMFNAIRRRLGMGGAQQSSSAPDPTLVAQLLRSGLTPDMVGM